MCPRRNSHIPTAVAKAGCLHLTRGLAKSCAPDIRVNCVAPGLMLTEWAAGFSEAQIQASKDITLLGGTSEVEDVAGAFSEYSFSMEARGKRNVH